MRVYTVCGEVIQLLSRATWSAVNIISRVIFLIDACKAVQEMKIIWVVPPETWLMMNVRWRGYVVRHLIGAYMIPIGHFALKCPITL